MIRDIENSHTFSPGFLFNWIVRLGLWFFYNPFHAFAYFFIWGLLSSYPLSFTDCTDPICNLKAQR